MLVDHAICGTNSLNGKSISIACNVTQALWPVLHIDVPVRSPSNLYLCFERNKMWINYYCMHRQA